ncbi:unnamed protein product [Clavelina lepadiformis]|uniref:Uncharacterized protein n=1 Tax=Clavelina lepadiformis TaxID=159417 RepID=A0ABP0GLR0_CLALP
MACMDGYDRDRGSDRDFPVVRSAGGVAVCYAREKRRTSNITFIWSQIHAMPDLLNLVPYR